MTRSAAVIISAIGVSAALVLAYAALGGGRYTPTAAANPCAPRPWHAPNGIQGTLEQIALSTADGAACDLGVSREELVLALAGESDLDRFAAEHGVTRDDADDAIRDGLRRAIDDAEQADAIGGSTAGLLRGIADRLPIGVVLAVLRGASGLLPS